MADDPDAPKPTCPPPKDFLPGYPTLTDFSNEGLKRVSEASRAFQSLPPAGPLWDLQKSYPEFRRAMKNCRTRIEPLIKILLEHEKVSTANYGRRVMEEKLDFLIEANDDILERVGTALDDADGLFKRAEMVVVNRSLAVTSLKPPGTWGKKKIASATTGGDFQDTSAQLNKKQPIVPINGEERPIKKAVHRIRVTEKPQLKFSDMIDNSVAPFVPKLKMKYNSIKPLSLLPEYTAANEEFYGHPYDVELNKWDPEGWMMEESDPVSPKPFDKTQFTLVVTPRQLETLVLELRGVKEIAVDLEHHSYRTFLGITCLIQISTREKDYIIDALTLWRELEVLNEIFTNPKIVKVFHGATSDLEWLQRDFGVYVVGLFDTYLAMKQLDFDQFSLQHLLSHFCSVNVDKTHQLADWRLRPLPDEMLNYARQDTHYLLYIHDLLKKQLVDKGNQYKNLLRAVYDQSRHLCLKRYEKPGRNPQLAVRKTRRNLNNRQLYAFTELYNWRDTIARERDESLGFVLPNHMLLTIAETLPKEMTGILACCEPVPSLVHQHLGDLHRVVLKARDLPLHEDKVEHTGPDKRKKQKDWMILLNSIHDFHTSTECSTEEVKSWPQPWVQPEGWEKLVMLSSSNFPLGRPRELHGLKEHQKSSAFERYELSNNVLDILRNPEKKGNLNMDDPLVRVVRETLLPEATEGKPLCESGQSQDKVQRSGLDRVLPEKEFVAFNPMGYGKRRGRKRSPSLLIHPSKKSKQIDVIDLNDSVNGEEEDQKPAIDLPLAKNQQVKQKGKFFDKLKSKWNKKKKGKNRNSNSNNPQGHEPLPKKHLETPNPVKEEPIQDRKRGRGFLLNRIRLNREGKSMTFKN